MSKTVLVTGCAGYIGSTLVRHLLDAGHVVIGVDALIYDNGHAVLPYLSDPHFLFYRQDVRDTRGLRPLIHAADAVVHLAAVVGAPACDKDPETAVAVNDLATLQLVKALGKSQKLIYPNTNSGYGETDGTSECTEDDPLNPVSVYGVSKCDGERAALAHNNAVSLRLATVFGASPRMRLDLMVNSFTAHLAAPHPLPLTIYEPNFKRNFVGVQDVCRAMLHALDNWHLTGVYNLGLPSANLTKLGLAAAICDTLGLSEELIRTGEGTDPDRRNYLVSNQKIIDTGFLFGHRLSAGIMEVAAMVPLFTDRQLAQMKNV